MRVSTVIGAGTVISALLGLLVGWVIGDVPRGLGNVFLWGMIATAVVGYLVAARNDRSQRSQRSQ